MSTTEKKGVIATFLEEAGGKMAESRILMDNTGMMMQLGAIPAP